MEISKKEYYLASLALYWADAGHNNKEKKSLCWSPDVTRLLNLGQLTQENQLAARRALLLALCSSRKALSACPRARSRVFQTSWGALWKNLLSYCAISDSVFSQLFLLKITCLNWVMQLSVGGVLILRALRSDVCGSMLHYFSPTPTLRNFRNNPLKLVGNLICSP